MSARTLRAKIRRVGTSLGIIIPKDALDSLGVGEGDLVSIEILPPQIEDLCDVFDGLPPFVREKEPRMDED